MDTLINTYLSNEWLPIIAAIVTLANAVTIFISSKSSNPIWQVVLDVLNAAAGNFAKNKNLDSQ